MASPWKDPRTGVWYFRRRVPKEHREAAGREIVKWSLETHDRREAVRKWPAALERWKRQVAEWSRAGNVETITPERAKEIAAMWASRILAGEPLALLEDETSYQVRERKPLALQAAQEAHARQALDWAGISVGDNSFPFLVDAMKGPVLLLYLDRGPKRPLPKRTGKSLVTVLTEALPAVPADLTRGLRASTSTGLTVTKLYERWAAVAAVKPRTATEARYHVEDFKRFLGHDDAGRVGVDDVRNWRDDLTKRGLNNNTVNARFGALRQIFARGEADGLITANPAEAKLRLPKKAAAPRHPYTQDEARRILEAARGETRASRRWAHWLMAFTGMRVGEVLQLMGRDVQQDGSIWFLSINEDDPTATVKNGQKRHVPLHPALIAEGFLKFAQGIAPDAPLFADKGLGKHGKRGERAWQVTGRWVREVVGITDPSKVPNHSWRHFFEDALRDAEVGSDIRDAIIGHAQKTTGRLYGQKGEALARLARAVEKVPSPVP